MFVIWKKLLSNTHASMCILCVYHCVHDRIQKEKALDWEREQEWELEQELTRKSCQSK